MDIFEAIKERRSCRKFNSQPVEEDKLLKVLEASGWAPSVKNVQPWRFVIIKNKDIKQKIKDACEVTKQFIYEKSKWKWVEKYSMDYLTEAPVIILVYANPKDTGVDQFLPGRWDGYAQSCCAAIQNMLLAAHALGLGSLWFTIYEKHRISDILKLPAEMDIISMVVLGYPEKPPGTTIRKPLNDVVSFID